MKTYFNMLLLTVVVFGILPMWLTANPLKSTLNQVVELDYLDTVANLNLSLSQNWNKAPTYFQDGITYAAEANKDTIVFKVRRYTNEAPRLDPFLVIQVSKEKAQSRVAVWEGEYAQDRNLDLTDQIKKWLKACTNGCHLSSQYSETKSKFGLPISSH